MRRKEGWIWDDDTAQRPQSSLAFRQAAGSLTQNTKGAPSILELDVAQCQREIIAQDRKTDLQTREPPVHPASQTQATALRHVRNKRWNRRRQTASSLGPAQCEAELRWAELPR